MQSHILSPLSQVNTANVSAFLERLLSQQSATGVRGWLVQQRQKVKEEGAHKLFLAFSLASRYFENQLLQLSPAQLAEAESLRAGFTPRYWSRLQAARTLLLLALAEQEAVQFTQTLARLAETADVAEQTALYAALPVLPHPRALPDRAAEGIRTNITVVFDAIALHNPYPADYLEERAWNQMVLKAVFMNRPLYQIQGAERRVNPALARMLLDFAHERWAAHRSVTPEIWRFIGPYLQEDSFKDIERVSREGSPLEREAVLMACAESSLPEARQLLQQYPDIEKKFKSGDLSWSKLGERYVLL